MVLCVKVKALFDLICVDLLATIRLERNEQGFCVQKEKKEKGMSTYQNK